MGQTLNGVGGTPEVWSVDGQFWLVHFVPDSEPPIPLAWQVRDQEELQSLYGPTRSPQIDRELTTQQAEAAGWLTWGFSTELANRTEHPWDVFVETYTVESQIRPWLSDPEVVALSAAAFMEGRTVTEAELKTTEWWQSHTQAERDWLVLNMADPATAERLVEDTRLITADAFASAGISNAGEGLINFVADRVTRGVWSQEYAQAQIRNLAEGGSLGPLDKELQRLLDLAETPLDTTRRREDEVRALVNRWLGPAHAAGWTDDNYSQWASKLRNDPDSRQELEQLLQQQRLVIFPHVTNPNLSYEDIAAPFRTLVQRVWGQQPDETDELFLQLVASNDVNTAQQKLRKEGLKRGVQQVVNDAVGAMSESFNPSGVIGVQ